ncbi:MAG TPA: hypothetical protein VN256_02835 [Pyrinomonadaceae bacterium]|nr:hypothetical protein [Pyrinomonadaceae bacterium]
MRRYLWLFAALCLLPFHAQAQSYRLNGLSEQLSTQAEDLASRSYSDYAESSFNNRSEIEALYLAQQFSASAAVFRRMVRDNRRESELKDAAAILSDLLGRADRGYSRRNRWADVRRTLDDVLRELNVRGGGGSGGGGGGNWPRPGDDGGRTSGRVRWRGTVDDNVQLIIRDDNVEVRTISGSPYDNATYNFTSPLPRRRQSVSVNKISGRGEVRVLQQPTRDNDYTAVIEIRDPKGEAREYEIEVSW